VAGDYNINLLDHETHHETDNFFNLMFLNKYYPLFVRPTRLSRTGSTLIDNIFTNYVGEYCKARILLNDISEHLPVFCLWYDNNNKILQNYQI